MTEMKERYEIVKEFVTIAGKNGCVATATFFCSDRSISMDVLISMF